MLRPDPNLPSLSNPLLNVLTPIHSDPNPLLRQRGAPDRDLPRAAVGSTQNHKEETHHWISSGSKMNLDYLPIFDLPAQVKMASLCAEVITPWARSELASAATQLTKSPCLFTPTAQFAIRSEIVQPFGDRVLATPESQPSMTTVA